MDTQDGLESVKAPVAKAAKRSKTLKDSIIPQNVRWLYGLGGVFALTLAVMIAFAIASGRLSQSTRAEESAFTIDLSLSRTSTFPLGLGSTPHPIPTLSPDEAQQIRNEYSPPSKETLNPRICKIKYDDRGFPIRHDLWHKELQVLYARNHERVPAIPPVGNRSVITPDGARVVCWPSSGGIWIKHAKPADLNFLYLKADSNTPRHSLTTIEKIIREEDRFCERLRMLGADFYEMPTNFAKTDHCLCSPLETCFKPTYHNTLGITWTQGDHAFVFELDKTREKYGIGLNGYYAAKLMEDRVKIAQKFETTIDCWKDWKDCKNLWCGQYENYCDEYMRLVKDQPTREERYHESRMENPYVHL